MGCFCSRTGNSERKFADIWEKCDFQSHDRFSDEITLYHATSEENAALILSSNSFNIPTRRYAIDNGLKAGAAVYAGVDPEYCLREARNTWSNEGRTIVLLKLTVRIGSFIDFKLYDSWAEVIGVREWEWMTERVTRETAIGHGFDSVSINSDTKCHEYALYFPERQIILIQRYDDS